MGVVVGASLYVGRPPSVSPQADCHLSHKWGSMSRTYSPAFFA